MEKKTFIGGQFKTHFILGLRFGIAGSLTGFILHALWGDLEAIWYTVVTGFSIGFFIGFFEWIFSNHKIKRLPYSIILLFRAISYFFITLICVYIILIIFLQKNGLGSQALADPQKFAEISRVYFLTNINTIYILLLTLSATFIWQLKSFFGKGVLINYLTGRYHKPSIEERIFMFLDLNDATTFAEKLGSKKYSSFLSDFFNDLDSAFVKTKGQVFQYVGDEVIVIWKPAEGLLNSNCIKAYLLAIDILKKRKDYYLDKYNVFPAFKASLHLGEVTITEIGVSKKEIVYHGDTINTASRICATAHSLGKSILISETLHDQLETDSDIIFENMGAHTFKGKKQKMRIYSILHDAESVDR